MAATMLPVDVKVLWEEARLELALTRADREAALATYRKTMTRFVELSIEMRAQEARAVAALAGAYAVKRLIDRAIR